MWDTCTRAHGKPATPLNSRTTAVLQTDIYSYIRTLYLLYERGLSDSNKGYLLTYLLIPARDVYALGGENRWDCETRPSVIERYAEIQKRRDGRERDEREQTDRQTSIQLRWDERTDDTRRCGDCRPTRNKAYETDNHCVGSNDLLLYKAILWKRMARRVVYCSSSSSPRTKNQGRRRQKNRRQTTSIVVLHLHPRQPEVRQRREKTTGSSSRERKKTTS